MILDLMRGVMRALAFCLLAAAAAGAWAAGYTARDGRIYDPAGQELQLRGISHFGFNAPILQPQFLWAMGWKQQIAQIKSLGFNAVRLPFVPDTLYNTTAVNLLSYVEPNLNADLIGKTPLQVMDLWMAEADRQGLYVLLDFHSVSKVRQYPTWYLSNPADFGLIHNQQAYTKEYWLRDLSFVAKRYANLPHFFAIDIYNEPNGVVRWSTGDPNANNPANYWKAAAESAAAAVLAANPNLMVFVQGINGNFDGIEKSNVPMNWGEDFQPQAYQPLAIALDKLVLSPHTYGPDVYPKSSFGAANFPANLAADWELLFGQFSGRHPVVIGEWGGRFGNGTGGAADAVWQNALVDYLVAKGMRSSFYWCYTPNSGDTGGILDDNLAVREDKMSLLRRLWGTGTGGDGILPQQTITGFTPTLGPVGTVVSVVGTGFTGTNLGSVGAGANASVTVQSATQLQLVVPAGATTGPIGLVNPAHSASSATAFTVTSAAPVYPQPWIANFAPSSGPVGTVVTVNGTGFTGLNLAWVGNARDGTVRVLGDTQAQVTIPSGATTGAIGLFNPMYVSFTATSFTVTASAPVFPQPAIRSFSPSSGRAGTVITLNGTGFTGLNQAWIGAARNIPVNVISDNQVRVTVPAGATTGAIGLFNPQFGAFTAASLRIK